MDGTLTRTNELIFASFNHVAGKYLGRTLPPHEIVSLFGPPEEGGLRRLLGRTEVGDAMEDLCAFYRREHGALAGLHPFIRESLEFLTGRGVRLAVFTGKGRRTASITLEELGIRGYFPLVVSGDDVSRHKPHHEGIQRVLAAFGCGPRETLMVGDSTGDVRAARSAGLRVGAALWDSLQQEEMLASGADYYFHTGEEMLHWFRAHAGPAPPEEDAS
ncbi:MAG: HAD-IA family hydrolase [Bacteroidota bacterium]